MSGADGETGEMGYPSALTAKTRAYDVSFKGETFRFQRPYGSYVMEKRAVQNFFPGRIPLANRRRSGDDAVASRCRPRAKRQRISRK